MADLQHQQRATGPYSSVDTTEDTDPLSSSGRRSVNGRGQRVIKGLLAIVLVVGIVLVSVAAATYVQAKDAKQEAADANAEEQGACADRGQRLFASLSTSQAGSMADYLQLGRAQCDVLEGKMQMSQLLLIAGSMDGAFQGLGTPVGTALKLQIPLLTAWKELADASLPCCSGPQQPYYAACDNPAIVRNATTKLATAIGNWVTFVRGKMSYLQSDFNQLWQVQQGSLTQLVQVARTSGVEGSDINSAISTNTANARDIGAAMDQQSQSAGKFLVDWVAGVTQAVDSADVDRVLQNFFAVTDDINFQALVRKQGMKRGPQTSR